MFAEASRLRDDVWGQGSQGWTRPLAPILEDKHENIQRPPGHLEPQFPHP